MIISAQKAHEAAEVLGIEFESISANAVTKAYRAKAKLCHPDHHGAEQLQLWSRVSWAYEALKAWVKQHPPEEAEPVGNSVAITGDCRACSGTGRVPVGKGSWGKPLTMQCVMCAGEGSLPVERAKHD